METKISIQPAVEPVSLSEAKAWLKVDNTADDDLISSLIVAARMAVEDYTNLKLIEQTIEETYDCFPAANMYNEYGALRLTHGPVVSVTSIGYQLVAGTYTALNSYDYKAHTYQRPAIITPAYNGLWPTVIKFPEAVKVTYVAGVAANAAAVPDLFKNAIKKMLLQWYEKRGENMRKIPTDVEFMLNVNRVIFW